MKKYTINQVHESKLLKQKRPSHIWWLDCTKYPQIHDKRTPSFFLDSLCRESKLSTRKQPEKAEYIYIHTHTYSLAEVQITWYIVNVICCYISANKRCVNNESIQKRYYSNYKYYLNKFYIYIYIYRERERERVLAYNACFWISMISFYY